MGEVVTQITVTISGGPELVEMIDVYDMDYQQAWLALDKLGLKIATPTYETSEEIAKNHVISSTPPKGAMIAPGTEISLVVSQGPKVKTTIVPTLIGRTQEQAENDLLSANLEVGRVDPVYDETYPEGTVVYQYPATGAEVEEGSTVNLQVSKGPDPDKQPAGPQEVEKTVTFTLPDGDSPISVQAMMDGVVIFSETRDPAMDLFVEIPVKGLEGETKSVTIYFNGMQSETKEVTF